MRLKLENEDFEEEDIDFFGEPDDKGEGLLYKSLKQSFGWALGFSAGLVFLGLFFYTLIYLFVLGGLITWEEVYLFLDL